MKFINNSNIDEVDFKDGTLTVKFRNGSAYDYSGVTPEQHQAFVNAESVGSHFHNHIRGKFEAKRREEK